MELKKTLEQFILFDKTSIIKEIEILKGALKIKNFKVPLTQMNSIYIKNMPFENNHDEFKTYLKTNKEKVIELYCNHNGKMVFLKNFGKIEHLNKEKLETIFRLLTLIKLFKKIDEVSYYSSQYYRSDKFFDELLWE